MEIIKTLEQEVENAVVQAKSARTRWMITLALATGLALIVGMAKAFELAAWQFWVVVIIGHVIQEMPDRAREAAMRRKLSPDEVRQISSISDVDGEFLRELHNYVEAKGAVSMQLVLNEYANIMNRKKRTKNDCSPHRQGSTG